MMLMGVVVQSEDSTSQTKPNPFGKAALPQYPTVFGSISATRPIPLVEVVVVSTACLLCLCCLKVRPLTTERTSKPRSATWRMRRYSCRTPLPSRYHATSAQLTSARNSAI